MNVVKDLCRDISSSTCKNKFIDTELEVLGFAPQKYGGVAPLPSISGQPVSAISPAERYLELQADGPVRLNERVL